MVFSLLIVGVFSTSNASVSMSGSLTFTASGVYAKVTANYSNDGSTTTKIGEKTFDSSNQGTEEWNNKNIAFNSDGHDVVLTITIQNLASDRDLYVKISDTVASISNLGKKLSNSSATISAGESQTFTITFSITDKNTSLSNATYGYDIQLSNEEFKGYTVSLNVESISSYYSETLTVWKYDGTTEKITSTGTYTINNVVQMQISYIGAEPAQENYNVYIVDGDTETYAFGVKNQASMKSEVFYSDLYEVTQDSSFIIKTESRLPSEDVVTSPSIGNSDSTTTPEIVDTTDGTTNQPTTGTEDGGKDTTTTTTSPTTGSTTTGGITDQVPIDQTPETPDENDNSTGSGDDSTGGATTPETP
jgi:hypothetical protein